MAYRVVDLNVSRGVQGNLETNVYRKPTHTDKYLTFDSHHPIFQWETTALPVKSLPRLVMNSSG